MIHRCRSGCNHNSKFAAAVAVPLRAPRRRFVVQQRNSQSDAAAAAPSLKPRRDQQQQQQQHLQTVWPLSCWHRLRQEQPAAAAAVITGLYATAAGGALVLAPRAVFGLLFDVNAVPLGWVRVGAVLFATFGLQYLGAGLGDARRMAAVMQQQQQQQRNASQQAPGLGSGTATPPSAAAADLAGTSSGGGGGEELADASPVPGALLPPAPPSQRSSPPPSSSSVSFYEASVWSRLFLAAAFAVLVVAGMGEPGLLVLAAVNAFGALSMRAALGRQPTV